MKDGRPPFASLIVPRESAVVLIADRRVGEDISDEEWSGAAFRELLAAAERHGVALLLLVGPGEASEGDRSRTLWFDSANPFADPAVQGRLARLHRSRLILGGAMAETALTFLALSALEDGYDVYLLRDLISGASESLAETAVARMIQAGAVPVSTMQVIAEWGCETGKAATRRFRKAG